jgi:hypothetical protein
MIQKSSVLAPETRFRWETWTDDLPHRLVRMFGASAATRGWRGRVACALTHSEDFTTAVRMCNAGPWHSD